MWSLFKTVIMMSAEESNTFEQRANHQDDIALISEPGQKPDQIGVNDLLASELKGDPSEEKTQVNSTPLPAPDFEDDSHFADHALAAIEQVKKEKPLQQRNEAFEQLARESASVYGIPESLHQHLTRRFVLVRPMAQGGMGKVFEAYDANLDMPVVVKFLKVPSSNWLERFKREAKATAKFASPYVVRIFDAGWSEDGAWYAMEKVEGTDLKTRLEQGQMQTAGDAVKAASDIAKGLVQLEKEGMVHRDLKPANILYREETDTYQLTDLGLVHVKEKPSLEQGGIALGTPFYMSPELAKGRHDEVTIKSDVWALGVTLYEMLSGEMPFNGENNMKILEQVLRSTPARLSHLYDVPKELSDLIARMLDKDIRKRPTPQEIVVELAPFLQLETRLQQKKDISRDETNIINPAHQPTKAKPSDRAKKIDERADTVTRVNISE